MSRAKMVGLTGGISVGKSAAANYLHSLGIPIIDSDLLAREVVEKNSPGLLAIKEAFGEAVIEASGELNRSKLGDVVFRDEKKRNLLNSILHPLIEKQMMAYIESYQDADLIVLDLPLLFETGFHLKEDDLALDEIWLISTLPQIQLQRLMNRDKISREFACAKINAQWPLDKKVPLSDRVIDNSTGLEELYRALDLVVALGKGIL